MLYSIIDKNRGERHGLLPRLHQLTSDGARMVVNENELRLVDADAGAAAALLGGRLMTAGEVRGELGQYITR